MQDQNWSSTIESFLSGSNSCIQLHHLMMGHYLTWKSKRKVSMWIAMVSHTHVQWPHLGAHLISYFCRSKRMHVWCSNCTFMCNSMKRHTIVSMIGKIAWKNKWFLTDCTMKKLSFTEEMKMPAWINLSWMMQLHLGRWIWVWNAKSLKTSKGRMWKKWKLQCRQLHG